MDGVDVSRQAGRKRRPRIERMPISTPAERPRRRRPDPDEPISTRRRWAAVLAGTLVVTFAFGAIAAAIIASDDGEVAQARLGVIVALVLTPTVFAVVGLVSRAAGAIKTTFTVAPLAVVVFVGLSLVLREPVTPTVVAFGLGGAFALRLEPGRHIRSWRVWGAIGAGVYTLVVFALAPGLATVMAPFLPLPILAVVDSMTERRTAG